MKNLNSCAVIVFIQSNKTSFITPIMTKILWLVMNLRTRFCKKNAILLRVVTKSNNVGKITLYLSQGFEINNKTARIMP